VEALGEAVVEVLVEDGFEMASGLTGGEALIKASCQEAGLHCGGTNKGQLGEGDVFDDERLQGIDGPVEGNEIGPEVGGGAEVFEADDGEVGGGEAVLASVLG